MIYLCSGTDTEKLEWFKTINTNLCVNKFVKHKDKTIMLQATSIYTQGNGEKWDNKEMFEIMFEISNTSLKMLGSDLFNQITKK